MNYPANIPPAEWLIGDVVEALCCGRLMPAWRVSLDGWCLDCAEVLTGCGDVP